MKMILSFKKCLAVCLLMVANAASASVVWEPTDGDISFITLASVLGFPAAEFGIFEDSATSSSATPVLTFTGGATISFAAGSGPDWTVSLLSDPSVTGTLKGSSHFQFGIKTSGGTWTNVKKGLELVDNSYLLAFGSKLLTDIALVTDITPSTVVDDDPVSQVPLPASVWMLTSALLGLLYTGRRKSVVNA